MAQTPAVFIEDVHKRFGAVKALNGISFAIEQGEFFGLLGPNGAGKSTLINSLAGLVRADRGRLEIMGHDVITDYRRSRMNVGVVPQELVYDPFFPIGGFHLHTDFGESRIIFEKDPQSVKSLFTA